MNAKKINKPCEQLNMINKKLSACKTVQMVNVGVPAKALTMEDANPEIQVKPIIVDMRT